jgi:hypothetical protein
MVEFAGREILRFYRQAEISRAGGSFRIPPRSRPDSEFALLVLNWDRPALEMRVDLVK